MMAHVCYGTCGLVAMTSAQHTEGRQFDPGQVYACVYVTLFFFLSQCAVCVREIETMRAHHHTTFDSDSCGI